MSHTVLYIYVYSGVYSLVQLVLVDHVSCWRDRGLLVVWWCISQQISSTRPVACPFERRVAETTSNLRQFGTFYRPFPSLLLPHNQPTKIYEVQIPKEPHVNISLVGILDSCFRLSLSVFFGCLDVCKW